MGDRLTPIDLSWGNSSTFTTNINQNFDDIATLLDTFLSRTDATTNFMDVALDMNSNDINNAGTIRCDVLLIDNAQIPSLEDIQDAFVAGQADIDTAVTAAQTAQAAAEAAQTAAETAETNAETAQAAAEAAAAGVDLPSIVGGDADKFLQVKDDETGYELVIRDRTPPAGFSDVGTHRVYRPIVNDDTYSYDVSANLTATVQETIGATGSGADHINTGLDDIPAYATGVILGVRLYAFSNAAAGNLSASLQLGTLGETIASADFVDRLFAAPVAGGDVFMSYSSEVTVPLATPGDVRFEAIYNGSIGGAGDSVLVYVYVNGYTY